MQKLYDVSLSFAGEDRVYVGQVATYLRNAGLKVFYDEFEKTQLWGKDLIDQLGTIYRDESEVVVMFVSRAYKEKDWTNYERRHALSTQLHSKKEYVLPVRFDDTVLEGLPSSMVYLDANDVKPDQLGLMIVSKLERLGVHIQPSRAPRTEGLIAWRIGSANFVEPLMETAQVASKFNGRWNASGTPVLYTASSYCAALMEIIPFYRGLPICTDLLATAIRIPGSVSIKTLYQEMLPDDWRERSAEDELRQLTAEWAQNLDSCILSVPAATLPYERTLLMNPEHDEFSQLEIVTRELVKVDSRLFWND